VKLPLIELECGSHWYRYEPRLSVTLNVRFPVNETAVALFTPGPRRWKLWKLDLSETLMT
jgi:hypothetical protein